MIKNIQTCTPSPQSLYNELLSKQNINLDNIPQSIDNLVINKNKNQTRKNILKFSFLATSLSIIAAEFLVYMTKNKKNINECLRKDTIKSYRCMQLFAPVVIGLISLGAYFSTQTKKNIGLISKEDIYHSQGFDIKAPKTFVNCRLSNWDYICMGIGATISLAKSSSKGRFKIPTIETGFSNKSLSIISDAILNGIALGGIYTIGKTVLKKENNQS